MWLSRRCLSLNHNYILYIYTYIYNLTSTNVRRHNKVRHRGQPGHGGSVPAGSEQLERGDEAAPAPLPSLASRVEHRQEGGGLFVDYFY